MKRIGIQWFLALIVVATRSIAAAENLSEEALFRRCYGQITQLRPRLENTLLAQVKNGSKSAVQACQEVFDSARLTAASGTTLANQNDPVAKAVLHTFNELHRSWSSLQTLFNSSDGNTRLGSETWYEDAPMGPYLTRALFSPAYNVDSITQGSDYLVPVRTTMNPPPSYNGVPNNTAPNERQFRITNAGGAHPFAPRGDLLGVETRSIPPVSIFPAVRFTNVNTLPDFPNLGVAPAATQALTSINFPDVTAVRGPLTETEQFAIRIQGQLRVTTPGTYTMFLDVDNGGSLILDGNRIINRTSTGEGAATPLTLTAGNHPLIVEYRQQTTTAGLILRWQGPGITKQVVPAAALVGLTATYHTHSQPLPVILTGNAGGGFIGNFNYLLTTFTETSPTFVPNGALATNRSWARAVLSDALCREIPVVREADVTQFVVPDSTTPFRQAAACNACHASVDRQAGLIRGLRYTHLNSMQQTSPLPDLIGMYSMTMLAPSLPENTGWSDVADNDYARRAPHGRFYFRTMHGALVDQEVRSMEELGAAIRSQDDYYACFAKRYYHYFTGINVVLGDPGDSAYPTLNAAEVLHRDKVLWLANRLKNSKSLSQLVFDIISSDIYRLSDYKVSVEGTSS